MTLNETQCSYKYVIDGFVEDARQLPVTIVTIS